MNRILPILLILSALPLGCRDQSAEKKNSELEARLIALSSQLATNAALAPSASPSAPLVAPKPGEGETRWEYKVIEQMSLPSMLDAKMDEQLDAAMRGRGAAPRQEGRSLWRLKPPQFDLTNFNADGLDGWELVSAVPVIETTWSTPTLEIPATPNTRTREIILFFKRPAK